MIAGQCACRYDIAASQIAIIAGLFYTGVGLLRLGWLTHYLSHAVVSGFMTGASITIGMSQVPPAPPVSPHSCGIMCARERHTRKLVLEPSPPLPWPPGHALRDMS